MTKYIFVTGGVISGLGKGVISASIGAVLQMLGEHKITIKKLDPYLNIDPGTMNPIEHGEVFVTKDGAETDLDLGYYERFLGIEMNNLNSTSSGSLYKKLLDKERNGGFLGKTVQMIPHFTDMIKEFICYDSEKYDYIICEIGGCVGDIEAMAFYESLRQLRNDLGINNILFIHLTYLLHYSITNELKTKPTQNTIRDLQQVGITPDILICRTEIPINGQIKDKLSLHTNLPKKNIIEVKNSYSIYEVPLSIIKEDIHIILKDKFNIISSIDTSKWTTLHNKVMSPMKEITIGLLGKYTDLNDSYKSLIESLTHAGLHHGYKINIEWINAREDNDKKKNINGIIIPGGFGTSGIETMLSYIKHYREKDIPVFGICLGMQLMFIEYCRNIVNIKDATSSEFSSSGTHVINKINKLNDKLGGTMRLGSKEVLLNESKTKYIYNSTLINERHRHRYIIDEKYIDSVTKKGIIVSGMSKDNTNITEIIELKDNKWYIGCQFHPEYQSNPFKPHPLFLSFVDNCIS